MDRIEKVAIIGAGTMGRRIAFGCVIRGIEARISDVSDSALLNAVTVVHGLIAAPPAGGATLKCSPQEARQLLHICENKAKCLEGVDLVIENVPEDLELKRTVLSELSGLAPKCAILSTNTSSIPPSWLADRSGQPEKFLAMNFGPPEELKVELMGHTGTQQETLDRVHEFIEGLGLIPIRVKKEIQGYGINRIWRAVKKEALFLIAGGFLTPEEVDRGWMLEWGTPKGPCGLMDQVGLDVVRDIEEMYFRNTGDPADRPPGFLDRMIEDGRLGEKTGRGFYEYPEPAFEEEGWLGGRVPASCDLSAYLTENTTKQKGEG